MLLMTELVTGAFSISKKEMTITLSWARAQYSEALRNTNTLQSTERRVNEDEICILCLFSIQPNARESRHELYVFVLLSTPH